MNFVFVSYDLTEGQGYGYYPPIHLCALATSLRSKNFDVKILDYSSSIKSCLKNIYGFRPDVIGLTTYTPYIKTFYEVTKTLRGYLPNAIFVAGGAHATVCPEWTLKNMPHLDFVMQGECDRSIVAFAEMVTGKWQEQDVPGLAYRRSGRIFFNKRDFIQNLDELPQVDRSFLDEYYKKRMYWNISGKGPLDMMITSRGCPYNCAFCFQLENKCRLRSVGHVMCEFENLKRRGVKTIHIQDDTFTLDRNRCLEIADILIREKYNFDLKIRSRVNLVDEELLCILKKAGVVQITYGFESGSQKMLDIMNKKTTVGMNKKAVDLTKKAGIFCSGDMMIGMPGETRETINETLSFLLEKKPIIGRVSVLYPLPGTKVYGEAKKNGTLRGDWTIDGAIPWVKLPWIESVEDLRLESKRLQKSVMKDFGTIIYFLKIHLKIMSWKQLRFLFSRLRQVF